MAKLTHTRAEGAWTYQDACLVIQQLKEIGVESGVTAGGIWMLFNLQQHGVAVASIIKNNGGRFCDRTLMESLTLERAERQIHQQKVNALERIWQQPDEA